MKGKNEPLIGQASAEELAAWKKEYASGFYDLKVGGHIAYFREPTRFDVGKALAASNSDAGDIAVMEEYGRLTYIGGSEAVLTDDNLFLAVWPALKAKMLKSETAVFILNH